MTIIGFSLHTLGELLIAYTVLRVHGRVVRDRQVDKPVINEMKLEQRLGVAGALLIVVGFALEIGQFL